MNIDDDILGITSLNNSLLSLHSEIFNKIKEDLINIEENKNFSKDNMMILLDKFETISKDINYNDSKNIINYFYELIKVNKILAISAIFSGLNIEIFELNTTLLLKLHLKVEGNLLKQRLVNNNENILDKEEKQELLRLKTYFNSEDSVLYTQINELINDVDRNSYSKDLDTYNRNKALRIKTSKQKDNQM